MQNAKRKGSEKEGHTTNQFNDSEYERWSKGITDTKSLEIQSGIKSFLGTPANLQPGREDNSISLIEIGKK
jgi:hypothetical protein